MCTNHGYRHYDPALVSMLEAQWSESSAAPEYHDAVLDLQLRQCALYGYQFFVEQCAHRYTPNMQRKMIRFVEGAVTRMEAETRALSKKIFGDDRGVVATHTVAFTRFDERG